MSGFLLSIIIHTVKKSIKKPRPRNKIDNFTYTFKESGDEDLTNHQFSTTMAKPTGPLRLRFRQSAGGP